MTKEEVILREEAGGLTPIKRLEMYQMRHALEGESSGQDLTSARYDRREILGIEPS